MCPSSPSAPLSWLALPDPAAHRPGVCLFRCNPRGRAQQQAVRGHTCNEGRSNNQHLDGTQVDMPRRRQNPALLHPACMLPEAHSNRPHTRSSPLSRHDVSCFGRGGLPAAVYVCHKTCAHVRVNAPLSLQVPCDCHPGCCYDVPDVVEARDTHVCDAAVHAAAVQGLCT